MATAHIRPAEWFSAGNHSSPPPHLGTRVDPRTRTFLPDPGNTVICHLDHDAPSGRAVLAVRERVMAMPEADRLAFTAANSLHMTVFDGINDFTRDTNIWDAVPVEGDIAALTSVLSERLAGFRPPGVFQAKAVGITPNGLAMAGATDQDEAIMRAWRDALAGVLGFRKANHDSYAFHITFAYLTDWLPDERVQAWTNVMDDCLQVLLREAPVISLHPPAWCSYRDMNKFDELKVLA